MLDSRYETTADCPSEKPVQEGGNILINLIDSSRFAPYGTKDSLYSQCVYLLYLFIFKCVDQCNILKCIDGCI